MAQGNDIILIPGNETRRHLEENIRAIDIRLSKGDLARLDQIFRQEPRPGPARKICMG
jgi:aryl-alcohol dehydrogenase-like predicted oxidoreductase